MRILYSVIITTIVMMIIANIVKVPYNYYEEFNRCLITKDEKIILKG